jgi:anthranilate synthase
LFRGLPGEFGVGRYHSLHAMPTPLPAELRVTALAEDDIIMAVEHTSLPIAAVQFHPESIMTLAGGVGPRIIANVMADLATPSRETADASRPTDGSGADRRALG